MGEPHPVLYDESNTSFGGMLSDYTGNETPACVCVTESYSARPANVF